ncbi:SUMF1/EgtB/PvdO family nonheme iron enzyme [Streptomyces sp. NPDC000931]|uniref:SUMF1/EgtB/PvdO family nonheme iron enzyme n=1 Tax=Streptomyces sp. NPDC000931 TaxID=3154372 RepID=UPI00331FA4C2
MSHQLDARLAKLMNELDDHSRVAEHLGLDFERPIKSLDDGYPENTIALVGKITERILKQLWQHHQVPGDPGGKALSQLIKGALPHIRSSVVLDALRDIQQLRNRSTHDGYVIAEEDGLTALRRLLDVLSWFQGAGSGILSGDAPRLAAQVARKAEFLAGLYLTLHFKPIKRFELSERTVYQLFVRERGLRSEYVELILSKSATEVARVLENTSGELLETRLPKLTRFLILEESADRPVADRLMADHRILSYERFMDAFIDLDEHLNGVIGSYPNLSVVGGVEIAGDLLTTDESTGHQHISSVGAADSTLEEVAASGGNLLLVGRSGSGKSTLLKQLVSRARTAEERRYRFYFDMSLKAQDESFADFIIRMLAPCMAVEDSYVFDVFHYFARSGSVLCALDGIDEAVRSTTQEGFLALFTEIAQILSAESSVIMSSRVSFLEDSPQVRRLLDGTTLMSEKLVQELHAHGVNPLELPRFSALRLHDAVSSRSPLELRLVRELPEVPRGTDQSLADLAWWHVTQVAAGSGLADVLPALVSYAGSAFLRGKTVFSFLELVNELGIRVFDGERLSFDSFRLRPLFRPVDASSVAFVHAAYQELLTAEYLRTPEHRLKVIETIPMPRLTEQLREFLHRRSMSASPSSTDECILPAGGYLVGPSHHLMLQRIERPVRFDRFTVTVARYKRFLGAVKEHGSTQWDHPDMPRGLSHEPSYGRLWIKDYYTNPAYSEHPALCVNHWSAMAFARFDGKRLPTSIEWEAAARGTDGRLFPWGDEIELSRVNSADSWCDRPLITYQAWLEEYDSGGLGQAEPNRVDAHPGNVSPFGVREMSGNVWEMTSTVRPETNEMVFCGGSFDNPYRALQASSKGAYQRHRRSNVIGFRCVEEIE